MSKILTIAHTIWLEMIRKKDVFVLLILLGAILVILISLDVFGLGTVVRYITDMGMMMAWIFSWILAINVSARELPQEESRGTIFPLLAKPLTRIELITGKWLGSLSIICTATLLFYALVIGVVLLKDGTLYPLVLLQGYILHCVCLSLVTAITIAFSIRMNYDAAASLSYVLTATAFLLVPRIPEFMTRETGFGAYALMFLYNLLPHFEVFDLRHRIVHGFTPLDWRIFGMVLAYGLLMTAAFLLIAWLSYRNKRFIRGNLI